MTVEEGTLTGLRSLPAGRADRIYQWRSEGCGREDARKARALDRTLYEEQGCFLSRKGRCGWGRGGNRESGIHPVLILRTPASSLCSPGDTMHFEGLLDDSEV